MNPKKIAILLAVILVLSAVGLMAGASTLVETDRTTSLQLSYGYDGRSFPGENVRIHRVATISAYVEYTLWGSFADLPVEVNQIRTQEEWNQLASTLAAMVVAEEIPPTAEAMTDENGVVKFDNLAQGLYFVEGVRVEVEGGYYDFGGFMISLPDLDENDDWVYDVIAKPKSFYQEVLPEEITYTVSKLWKDAGNEYKRPQNITLELYQNETLVETVVLSAENDWTYSWTALDDGSVWYAVEKNVPDGYTVTLSQEGNHFTVINTYDNPPPPPQTGDTTPVGLYLALMALAGVGLIVVGIVIFRKKNDEK